jgi:hypothetical protein
MWLLPFLKDSTAGAKVLLSGRNIWLRPRVAWAWPKLELDVDKLEEGEGSVCL